MNKQQSHYLTGTLSENPRAPGSEEVPVFGVDRSSNAPSPQRLG